MQNQTNRVRFSRLKKIAASPAHYAADVHPESSCVEQGSAVDALIYGTKAVVAYPGAVRRGKEYDAFLSDHPESSFIIQTKKGLEESVAIANAVTADKRAMRLLKGERQKEILWSYCGRDCISHPDTIGKNGAWIADLKVSQTSNPNRFKWHALKMLYHCQLAFYGEAVATEHGGIEPRAYYNVVVEATFPHVVTVFKYSKRAIEAGKKFNRIMMERLIQCEQANQWPGYSQSVVEIDVQDDDAIFESEGISF